MAKCRPIYRGGHRHRTDMSVVVPITSSCRPRVLRGYKVTWNTSTTDIGAGTDTDFIGVCTPGLTETLLPGRETNHWPPFTTEVKNEWTCTCSLPYAFLVYSETILPLSYSCMCPAEYEDASGRSTPCSDVGANFLLSKCRRTPSVHLSASGDSSSFECCKIDVLEWIWPPGKELLTGPTTVRVAANNVAHVDKVQDKRLRGSVQSDPVRVTNRPGPRDVLHVLSAVQGNEQQPEGKSSKHWGQSTECSTKLFMLLRLVTKRFVDDD